MADFDSLIELITTDDQAGLVGRRGGTGSDRRVSPAASMSIQLALLRKLPPTTTDSRAGRRAIERGWKRHKPAIRAAPRPCAKCRSRGWSAKCNCSHAQGREPSEAMQTLAGLRRIKYILVYPETGDIVLAGPAGDWRRDARGPLCRCRVHAPVLNLDDLVVTLRNADSGLGRFGCSIDSAARTISRRPRRSTKNGRSSR